MKNTIKKITMFMVCLMFVFGQNLLLAQSSKTFKDLMSEADKVKISSKTVTFIDDSGRKKPLKIKKNPKKVAVLYGSHSALWIECGGSVAVGIGGNSAVELYKEQIGRDITKDAGFIQIAKSSSATNWDIEKILATNPDLIICSTAMNGYRTISGPAAQMKIPVIAISYDGIRDYLKWSKVFTALNSREDLFKSIALKVGKGVADIIDKVPTNKKAEVLSLLPGPKTIRANMPTSNIGEMLKDLKATNVVSSFSDDTSTKRLELNIEQIYKLDPYMILIQIQKNEDYTKKNMEAGGLTSNPIWNELSAVKENRLYYLPKLLFHNRPNRDYLEAYKMLAEILYPSIKF